MIYTIEKCNLGLKSIKYELSQNQIIWIEDTIDNMTENNEGVRLYQNGYIGPNNEFNFPEIDICEFITFEIITNTIDKYTKYFDTLTQYTYYIYKYDAIIAWFTVYTI